jgi:hypothetical protein
VILHQAAGQAGAHPIRTRRLCGPASSMPSGVPGSENAQTPSDKAGPRARRPSAEADDGRRGPGGQRPALTLVKHIEMAPKTTRGKLTPISGDGPKAPNAPPEPPDRDDWRTTFRADIPSSTRIYDYFLSGKDDYPGDRGAGDQIIAHLPNIREATQINRAFVPRAVRTG